MRKRHQKENMNKNNFGIKCGWFNKKQKDMKKK